MSRGARLGLIFRTVRHLSARQIGARVERELRWRCRRLLGWRAPQPDGWQFSQSETWWKGVADVLHDGGWSPQVHETVRRSEDIAAGRFLFLNRPVEFGGEPDWHGAGGSRLWRFHLHYFDYVQDLLVWAGAGHGREAYEAFRSIALSWIERNRTMTADGWHPYTLSLRIVNWVQAAAGFENRLEEDPQFRRRLLGSLYGQARVLSRDLELDVRGNHLLENLRALIHAGTVFQGPEPRRWLQASLALLQRELREQVLADGGHFERSPGYHLRVLRNCLELAICFARNGQGPFPWLDAHIRRMLDYMAAIMPPDMQVPLLKDTSREPPVPCDLLAAGALYLEDPSYKRGSGFGLYPLLLFGLDGWKRFHDWPAETAPRRSVALRTSNHYVMRDDAAGEHLIFDGGIPCPDYLPAHAHADMLAYELIVSGRRVVVDSGVYEYAEGPWREYFRSTRAHNTVEVGGRDQSEVWSSFRVAHRARPAEVTWQENDDCIVVQGGHDGYMRLPVPVMHRRTLAWRKGLFWLVADELSGQGVVEAVSYVHIQPGAALVPDGQSRWRIDGCGSGLWIAAFGEGAHEVARGLMEPQRQGWHSERFGVLEPNPVLSLRCDAKLPACFGYVISKECPGTVQARAVDGGTEIVAEIGGRAHRLILEEGNAPALK